MDNGNGNEFFVELFRKNKITDYLLSKGYQPSNVKGRAKYKCPLPSHPGDNTPSFYVTDMPDGSQLYKCFGCGSGGNIVTLIRNMEGHKNGHIIARLAKTSGVIMGNYIEGDINIEPSSFDVLLRFCEEDEGAQFLSQQAKEFIRAHDNCDDVVDKIAKIYQMLDEMIEVGDAQRIDKTFTALQKTIIEYEG